MERFLGFVYGFTKLLTFLFVAVFISVGNIESCFWPHSDEYKAAELESADGSAGSGFPVVSAGESYKMQFGFYIYDSPSFEAAKIKFLKPQYVRVLETADGGWAYVEISAGTYWVNLFKNEIYVGHHVNGYDAPKHEGEPVLLEPQQFVIAEKGGLDWFLVETAVGRKWVELSSVPQYFELSVKSLYDQTKRHPTACEAYSATVALNIQGIDITPSAFIAFVPQNITKREVKNGTLIWGDPNEEFVGNMLKNGYSIYPPALEKTINENFNEHVTAKDISGAGFNDIVAEVSHGAAVLIWFHPSGESVSRPETWYTPGNKRIDADYGTHTVAVTGYNLLKGTVIYYDPIGGVVREQAWNEIDKTYTYTGRKSLVVRPVTCIS